MKPIPTPKFNVAPRVVGSSFAIVLAAFAALLGGAAPMPLMAQSVTSSGSDVHLNDGVPKEVEEVTVTQNLGGQIPQDLSLVDSQGRAVKSARYFDGEKPVLVTLNYSDCPMLCSVQLNALTQSLQQLDLKIGDDFRLLTVSIDPEEDAARIRKTKRSYTDQLPEQPGTAEGWAFCTADKPAIARLTKSLGFEYTYDEASGEYYHPAMLAFVSPEGVITRYSLQVDFPPDQLKLALVEAGEGNVGGAVDQFILWCYSYDPEKGSYVAQAWRIMQLGGAATVALMLVTLAPYWIGRKRAPRSAAEPASQAGESSGPYGGQPQVSPTAESGARK